MHRLPEHTSFSARETLQRCARSWFLKYVAKAPKRPALWSVGGSAVHETTEHYDLMSVVGNEHASKENIARIWETYFDAQLHKAGEKEPNEHA
ncbi:PD-(D/E)XK nuclease family protein [Streptomyces sp. NPDC003247]|uniref:PD-(D/E)XK nuclease family protein n=1 Tax=Streptomyces sp. NPDC003247 TaxID=3364677 RepID=UPI0036A16D1E